MDDFDFMQVEDIYMEEMYIDMEEMDIESLLDE